MIDTTHLIKDDFCLALIFAKLAIYGVWANNQIVLVISFEHAHVEVKVGKSNINPILATHTY